MIDLMNEEEIKKLDPKNVYGSTGMLADQCQQMLDNYFGQDLFTQEYKSFSNVVICGMGGSAYGGHIVQSLYHDALKFPLSVVSDYSLPHYTNDKTLTILTSYSGSTEEVLSCAEDAVNRNAKITGFSSGGKLWDFLRGTYPGFAFNPQHNPSGQPRLGTGYVIMSTLTILKSAGVIDVSKEDVQKAIDELRRNTDSIKSHAREFAQKLQNHIPVIMAGEFLYGNSHVMRNQFNETSKSFSAYAAIPELNHHLMEGLKYPEGHKLMALLLTSSLYSEKIQKRFALTNDVIAKNAIEVLEYKASGSTKLSQVLEVLSLGGYITVYLGLLYGQDPSLIPWVDYFKQNLKS